MSGLDYPSVSKARRIPVMTQAPVSHSVPTAPDYDRTLVLAIELSNKSWVLAAQVPGLPRVKAKRTIECPSGSIVSKISALGGHRTP